MRVLFVSRGFPPHGRWGTEAYTLQLARGLAREGHEVSVFHPDVRDDREPYSLYEIESEAFRVTRVVLPRVRSKRLAQSYEDPELEAAFERVLLREPPDVVHFTYLLWTLSVRMPAVAKRHGLACVLTATDFGLTCHRGQYFDWRLTDCGGPQPAAICARCIREPSSDEGNPTWVAGKRWLAHSLALVGGCGRVVVRGDVERREAAVRAALASIDEAVAPTPEVGRMLLHAGMPAERITSLCYAVDAEQFAHARARPQSPRLRIGFIGQFAPHKGPHVLLEAVAILERRLPESVEPWEVTLYGEGVEGRHRLYPERLRKLARSPRVSIAPAFEPQAVGEILAGLSCVVVPSLWRENAPLCALEARAAGIPVIASDVPGLSEILSPGVHGALFPAGDAVALADLLRAVILGRIAPRHAPSQPLGYAEHVARVTELPARDAARPTRDLQPAVSDPHALGSIGERARDEGLDIGFVSMGFPPDVGGIETQLGQLARELLARGHRVHVLCLDTKTERAPYSFRDTIDAGVRVRRVAYRYHDHRALADLALRRTADDVLMAWLAEEPCDVVHVHHAGGFGAGMLQAIHEMGRPLLVTLHDYWMLCPRGQMLRNDGVVCDEVVTSACAACLTATWPQLMPSKTGEPRGPRGEALRSDEDAARARSAHALEMLALPARLFAPSAAARAVFERAGVPPGRIQVLANGVETGGLAERVEALRREHPMADGKVRVGVLGSAQPSKGVLEFSRAVLSIENPVLVIEIHGALGDYHGDPSYAESLRRLAAQDSRLVLCGEYAHSNLARILARLDALAVPSRWNEVFGLSAREARAAGLFVFASDRGGLGELRGDPGVQLLAAEEPEAWRSALTSFLRSPAAERRLPAPARLRSAHELALDLEGHYVELVRTQLGRDPRLCFETGSDRAATRTTPAPAQSGSRSRKPWWTRIF